MANPETHVDLSQKLKEWHIELPQGYYELSEAYLNGTIVFKKALDLYLPQPTSNAVINLRTFIDANNPENYDVINVWNLDPVTGLGRIQPSITSGNLAGLEVEFLNPADGEVQGSAAGYDAFIATSTLTLNNLGYIRGAGGAGGIGGTTPQGNQSVGTWENRAAYDDGGPYDGSISPSCVSGGTSDFYNRFWKSGGGANSGAWVSTTCANQVYWDTNNAGNWGDQTNVYNVPYSGYHKGGSGNQYVVVTSTMYLNSGAAGAKGSGQSFSSTFSSGGSGNPGYISGTTSGFDTSTGNTIVPDLSPYTSGNGGAGGNWAVSGTGGSPSSGGYAGGSGQAAGAAINGSSFLTAASTIGNIDGAVI